MWIKCACLQCESSERHKLPYIYLALSSCALFIYTANVFFFVVLYLSLKYCFYFLHDFTLLLWSLSLSLFFSSSNNDLTYPPRTGASAVKSNGRARDLVHSSRRRRPRREWSVRARRVGWGQRANVAAGGTTTRQKKCEKSGV